MTALDWLGVAVLGAAGAYARFFVDGLVSARAGRTLPFGTFAVNLSGAFLLGLLAGAALDPRAYRLAGTALLGAYTTFSTWMLETQRLIEQGQLRAAATNLGASLVLGVAVAALGRWLGGLL